MCKFSIHCLGKMAILCLLGLIAGFSQIGVSGRAVNISSVWFLPQEGFPVFYRYFRDKVTWDEAEAVCGFHHSDLLSVQTSSQMDAARGYLKEIDVTDNVWIGLQKESPEKLFSWTNGEQLFGDGYWTEPIPKTNEKLCAAIDPMADFRWNSFYCNGPQVAAFVCQLSVPEWAKKENGCLATSLPSLTITFIPEAGVIQLLSDCGLDGTKRIACNGGMSREEIIKRLSCDVDAFTVFSKATTANAVSSDASQHYETTRTYSTHTRHRRSANISSASTANVPVQARKNDKKKKSSALNVPSRAFPHSPYLASVRNAPSTKKPQTIRGEPRKPTSTSPIPSTFNSTNGTEPLFDELPVLIITGEELNDSVSSATSENPQIILMIENKDLEEPFLVPLSDDIFLNNPSLSPVEVINVDLIKADNLTVNSTTSQASPSRSPSVVHPLRLVHVSSQIETSSKPEDATEESLNAVEEKGGDVPPRPNRGCWGEYGPVRLKTLNLTSITFKLLFYSTLLAIVCWSAVS